MNKLPNFKLKLIDDTEIKSSRIKKTILFFYPKAMTSGCTIEVCDFQSNLNKKKKLGFEIIGISKERTIDVLITRLRQKIESSPKNPKYLQTIRGSGYVLWIK